LLLDDMQVTEPFLLSVAQSPAGWLLQFDATEPASLKAIGVRVLNRALGKFQAAGTTVVRVKEASISRLLPAEEA
jgi:hypothetical protein